jgi:flagellar motor switch protein FliN/FliY
MTNLVSLIEQETVGTIEGLTGFAPSVSSTGNEDAALATLSEPLAATYFDVEGDISGQIIVVLPVNIATALGDLMLAGEGDAKDDMDDDDLDATKEIVSNILATVSTALTANSDMPNMKFNVSNIVFAPVADEVPISSYDKVFSFDFSIASQSGVLSIVSDETMTPYFTGDIPKPAGGGGEADAGGAPMGGGGGSGISAPAGVNLSESELQNMSLIMDVKLPIKVRIGSKTMLLKDVISMDIGSVIELDRLVNDPLDILVDEKIIGKGEVVIVDGNFGIQVTEVLNQRERLEAIRKG